MPSPHIVSVSPGQDSTAASASHILGSVPREALPRTVVLVPNRRSVTTLRDAIRTLNKGEPLLMPRILPLAQLPEELPLLLGTKALEAIRALPPAMPEWQRLCLLAAQVQAFERKRMGGVTLEQALRLAADLATLQDSFTRAGEALTMERLRTLIEQDFAEHWQQSLSFLSIVADMWPAIEREQGMVTQEASSRAASALLVAYWRKDPPDFPVFVIGSTASQPATAELMACVANMERGAVILPGLAPGDEGWSDIRAGHPYYHLRLFLDRLEIAPSAVPSLAPAADNAGLWLTVLGPSEQWRKTKKIKTTDALKLVPCQHGEEEARVIALLMRESEDQRTALVTPDETLMGRVAAQLQRYGIAVDRLSAGTLATTETGSLLALLVDAIQSPERMLPLMNLLRHALVHLGKEDAWQRWLAAAEPRFRGTVTTMPGELPHLGEPLAQHPLTAEVAIVMREIVALSQSRLAASAWVKKLTKLLARVVPVAGSGQEAIEGALDELSFADALGALDIDGFAALLARQLEKPWRQPVLHAHPNLYMLTPVEARLLQFDRVILANMQASLWPGVMQPGPWLNFSQQQALGLPAAEERITLMAHDVLMLGCAPEVFFTWPQRDAGAPTTRSPFIEKLVAYLELQGIKETAITAQDYLVYARALFEAEGYHPAPQAKPTPKQRPATVHASTLDRLFSDPYHIYAKYILGLAPLRLLDAEPEARDFGTVAHNAIQLLSTHWSTEKAPANESQLARITDNALRRFSERANVQLFWRNRLIKALRFVNEQEETRRKHTKKVRSETPLKATLALAGGKSLTLEGRIDRLEETNEGLTVADYKTGAAPNANDMEEGRAVQLLAYAMLLAESGQKVAAVEYWELPRANNEGTIERVEKDFIDTLLPQLRAALADMLQEGTPFLARPAAANDRFDNDYDGISRYGEWAG